MTMEYVSGYNLEEFLERHVETDQYIPTDLAVLLRQEFAVVWLMHTVKRTHKIDSLA